MQADLIKAFFMLFVVMDSLGNVPIFHSMLRKFDPKSRRDITRKSVLVAACILVFFAVLGTELFSYFGVRMSDLRIASGLVLFVLALREFFEAGEERETSEERITVFPLATPLLAGPGSISTVIIISEFSGGLILTIAVVLANAALSYFVLSNSDIILSKLGQPVAIMTAKISNLIVAAFAVSLVRQGVEELVASLG